MDRYADSLDEAATEGDAAKMRPDEDPDEPTRRRQGAELGKRWRARRDSRPAIPGPASAHCGKRSPEG